MFGNETLTLLFFFFMKMCLIIRHIFFMGIAKGSNDYTIGPL